MLDSTMICHIGKSQRDTTHSLVASEKTTWEIDRACIDRLQWLKISRSLLSCLQAEKAHEGGEAGRLLRKRHGDCTGFHMPFWPSLWRWPHTLLRIQWKKSAPRNPCMAMSHMWFPSHMCCSCHFVMYSFFFLLIFFLLLSILSCIQCLFVGFIYQIFDSIVVFSQKRCFLGLFYCLVNGQFHEQIEIRKGQEIMKLATGRVLLFQLFGNRSTDPYSHKNLQK